jgi:DNA-binding MarR family transcriptional regulator
MEAEEITQRELAERRGVTPPRISQWLSLLQLPGDLIANMESLSDHWTRRLVTERQLRTIRLRNDPLC